nr:HAMP domain-containing histidine kinase [Ardenticatenales bacterium]
LDDSEEHIGTLRTFYRLNPTLRDSFGLVAEEQRTGATALLLPTGQQLTTERGMEGISESTLAPPNMTSLERGETRLTLDGASYLVRQASVTGTAEPGTLAQLGWRILELEPLETILAPVGRQIRLTILLALAIAGAVAASAFAGGQILTRPILTLNEVVTRFATGELSVRAPIEQEDEIGELATSFNSMAETLADREMHLEEARATAEHANHAKSSFLAGMSHELRTPLNSIIGYAEIMIMGLNGPLSDEMKEDVEAIHSSGKHLLSLINDVLDLAKVEAGRMKLQYEEVNVPTLLKKIHDNNVSLVRKKPVEFKIEASEELPKLPGDPIRLTQILNNLVSNAIKHTEEGSVCLRARQEGEWMALSVEDTGVGISQENIGAIFDEFSQVDRSSERRAEGTGLGLPITLRLIKLHGGTIDVQSTLDVGSTFTVRLPLHPPSEVPGTEASNEKAPTTSSASAR